MTSFLRQDTDVQPFSASGYEILDDELARRREVTIWSIGAFAPRLGDLFLIESGGVLHDVAVIDLAIFKGGWSAVARVVEVY